MISTSFQQFPLDLIDEPVYGVQDFVVAPCNADAMAWVHRWPNWPGQGLIIHGPPGCGKSHLATIWRSRSGATFIDGQSLPDNTRELTSASSAVIVESAETASESKLLHLYNALVEERKTMLLTTRSLLGRWPIKLPDLSSRIGSLPVVGIRQPDDSLLQAILVKQFSDRQLKVKPEVISYLVIRMERSFEVARKIVAVLDEMALDGHKSVSISLAKRALGKLEDLSPVVNKSRD